MRKLLRVIVPVVAAVALLLMGMPSLLRAQGWIEAVPEIDPTTGMAAVALLAGVVMMIRGRRKTSTD
jgi:uncharacterized membrane protein YozB (DUF420 family)